MQFLESHLSLCKSQLPKQSLTSFPNHNVLKLILNLHHQSHPMVPHFLIQKPDFSLKVIFLEFYVSRWDSTNEQTNYKTAFSSTHTSPVHNQYLVYPFLQAHCALPTRNAPCIPVEAAAPHLSKVSQSSLILISESVFPPENQRVT